MSVSKALNPSFLHIESLSKASHALTSGETLACGRAAEISKEVLKVAAQRLVARAHGAPVLRSSSCDGTPMSVRLQAPSSLGSSLRESTGRQTHEMLIMIGKAFSAATTYF